MHKFYLDFSAAVPPFLSGVMAWRRHRTRGSVLDNSPTSLFVAFFDRRSYSMPRGA